MRLRLPYFDAEWCTLYMPSREHNASSYGICSFAPQNYQKGKKAEAVYINGEFESNPANQEGYYSHTEATQAFEKVRVI